MSVTKGEDVVSGGEQVGAETRSVDLFAERVVRGRAPGLEAVAERFMRALRPRVSARFAGRLVVESIHVEQKRFGAWLQTAPQQLCAYRFSSEPFPGTFLLSLSPRWAEQVIDLQMGGSGRVRARSRMYTSLDQRLLHATSAELLEVFADAWDPLTRISVSLGDFETHPHGVQVVTPSDWVYVLGVSCVIAEEVSVFEIVIPRFSLDAVRHELESAQGQLPAHSAQDRSERVASELLAVMAKLQVVLAQGSLRAEEVLSLKVGDVIPLTTAAAEDALVLVEGVPKFKAKISTSKGNKAAVVQQVLMD